MSPSPLAPVTTFVILATRYVPGRGERSYYEIEVGADHGPDGPRVLVVTSDETLIARALLLEGTEARVAVQWQRERHSTSGAVRLRLLRLEAL